MSRDPNHPPIDRLKTIMAALRHPETGCPWDLKQDFASIAPYTLEEAYEVVDAIERGDTQDLRQELGDLLLQVVFHAQMAEEQGDFNFDDVANAISDKMERRHRMFSAIYRLMAQMPSTPIGKTLRPPNGLKSAPMAMFPTSQTA